VLNRKNVFVIARKNSEGDEDQLTELLAYAFQEDPSLARAWLTSIGFDDNEWTVSTQRRVEGGRLDIEFVARGAAHVIVESKIGSTTDYQQCAKYIDHLRAASPGATKALALLTKYEEPWPPGIQEHAAADIQLLRRRWWDFAAFCRGAQGELAHDFAAMLEQEGMVIPKPLVDADWGGFERIEPTLRTLLGEAKASLAGLSGGPIRQALFGGITPDYRSLYCLAYFERAQIALGFAASVADMERHRRGGSRMTVATTRSSRRVRRTSSFG
jgi:hypothetical protein